MSHFTAEVGAYMSAPAFTVSTDTSLEEVYRSLRASHVSSLAVTQDGKLAGVITRTDILRIGKRQAGSSKRAELLTLPNQSAHELMSKELLTVSPEDTIESAAQLMLKNRVHRVYVTQDGRPVGVLSTRDIMLVIRDKRLNKPISTFMSSPIFSIRAQEPISLASERLEKARVSGLVVMDDGLPVGVFTQSVALNARYLPRETPVEEFMSPAILLLGPSTPVFRAAAQAATMEVRRVIVWDGHKVSGILTGLDFTRAAAPIAKH